jgi:hypothetical protein
VTTDAFQRILAQAPSIEDRLDRLSPLKPDARGLHAIGQPEAVGEHAEDAVPLVAAARRFAPRSAGLPATTRAGWSRSPAAAGATAAKRRLPSELVAQAVIPAVLRRPPPPDTGDGGGK